MKFSERIGKAIPKTEFQLDSMDHPLRTSLWNMIDICIKEPLKQEYNHYTRETSFKTFFDNIWFSFFKEPIDEIPEDKFDVIGELRKRFFEWDYLQVYDFIDHIINMADVHANFRKDFFISGINAVLKKEFSGYRIIDKLLSPITSENEILEVGKAINNTSIDIYEGAHIHITEALKKISDRKKPDYRNSIKEAISAVESVCQVISGDPKAELGKALKILSNKLPIHGALEQGFIKIYGYTSDSNGIRHALLEETSLDQEDAMFMLISCSAFINYLIVKVNKAKNSLQE